MLAETVTRLEMSWKKLQRAEKQRAEADREKSSEKGTGRETDREERIGRAGARGRWRTRRGWESEVAAAYVIRGEKTELKARYHLSSGKWYSDAPVVFHVGGFYNARYCSPLSVPLPPSLVPFSPFPPTLAGCGLHPAAFTSLFPSTYASGTDILQATHPSSALLSPSLSLSCPLPPASRALNRCL